MSEVSIHLMILKIEIKCLKSRNIKLKTRAIGQAQNKHFRDARTIY